MNVGVLANLYFADTYAELSKPELVSSPPLQSLYDFTPAQSPLGIMYAWATDFDACAC